MCKWGTTVPVEITVPARLSHTGNSRKKIADVDSCIVPLVKALNDAGIVTDASCCGHGKQPTVIALADGRELRLFTQEQSRKIDRAFKPINIYPPLRCNTCGIVLKCPHCFSLAKCPRCKTSDEEDEAVPVLD